MLLRSRWSRPIMSQQSLIETRQKRFLLLARLFFLCRRRRRRRWEKKLVKNWFSFLPSALSSCSILPTSASIVRRTTETISWNFVCAGTITNPSWRTRWGHSSRATTQWTGKNLLLNARPRNEEENEFSHLWLLCIETKIQRDISLLLSILRYLTRISVTMTNSSASSKRDAWAESYLPRVCPNGVKPLFFLLSRKKRASALKKKIKLKKKNVWVDWLLFDESDRFLFLSVSRFLPISLSLFFN